MKILITGVGGPAGICFAKSLSKDKEITLVGVDAGDLEISRNMVETFYIVPMANDPLYIQALQDIIKKEEIDLLIPLVDEELSIISANLDKFDCRVLVSPSSTILLTTDKGDLYKALSSYLPKRFNKTNAEFPLLVKPRIGRGSRDIHIVKNITELDLYDENKYVFQEVLNNPEITVDALFDFEHNLVVAVPRIRVEVKEGISIGGRVVNESDILNKVKEISKILKFTGPINFQFMKSSSSLGEFKLIEINARSSGGMGITINSGIDIPKLSVELIKNGFISNIPTLKEGEFFNFEEIIARQKEKELKKYNDN